MHLVENLESLPGSFVCVCVSTLLIKQGNLMCARVGSVNGPPSGLWQKVDDM